MAVCRDILIIGAGQIGTSLALALRQPGVAKPVSVYDIDPSVENDFRNACKRHRVQNVKFLKESDLREALAKTRIVILATPVKAFADIVKQITPHLPGGSIVTDVGSVKDAAIKNIEDQLQGKPYIHYIPTHPLSGKKGSGPLTASPDMFKGRPAVIINHNSSHQDHDPRAKLNKQSAECEIRNLWQDLGANTVEMTVDAHDKILAATSHLQHVIAFSLVLSGLENGQLSSEYKGTATWLASMTRIAEANPDVWSSIFQQNRKYILEAADHFRATLLNFVDVMAINEDQVGLPVAQATRILRSTLEKAHINATEIRGSEPQEAVIGPLGMPALISVAQALNVKRVEAETRQAIAPIANPSLKDVLRPAAADPEFLWKILQDAKGMIAMDVDRFLQCFDSICQMIRNEDIPKLKETIGRAAVARADEPSASVAPEVNKLRPAVINR